MPSEYADEAPPEDLELEECDGCGRKFNPKALAKHAVRGRGQLPSVAAVLGFGWLAAVLGFGA
jgi:hypothetical protein